MNRYYNFRLVLIICGLILSLFFQNCGINSNNTQIARADHSEVGYKENTSHQEKEPLQILAATHSSHIPIEPTVLLDLLAILPEKDLEEFIEVCLPTELQSGYVYLANKPFEEKESKEHEELEKEISKYLPIQLGAKKEHLTTEKQIEKAQEGMSSNKRNKAQKVVQTSQNTIPLAALTFSMLDAPVEVLQKIVSYLPFDDLMSARQTNHLFYTLITGYDQVGVMGVENKPNYYSHLAGWEIKRSLELAKLVDRLPTMPSFIFYQLITTAENKTLYQLCIGEELLGHNNQIDVLARATKYCKNIQNTPEDIKKILEELVKKGNQGNIEAQIRLARRYKDGLGVAKNDNEAFRWYKKAARKGSVEAQFSVGYMYDKGQGVEQSFRKARKWYHRAVDRDDPNKIAQYKLARMYENGRGLNRDYIGKAFEFYRKSAEQGYAKAQVVIGKMYERGLGTNEIIEEARKWYEIAAKNGHPSAQFNLGRIYFSTGKKEDQAKGLTWYIAAAEQSHRKACNQLGLIYYQGIGVEKNIDQALEYFQRGLLKKYNK